jgi:hypothetical protein
MAKLSSALPEGDKNGLAAIDDQLVATPDEAQLIVAFVNCSRITTECDSGDVVPTARILGVEALSGKEREKVERAYRLAHDQRVGRTPLIGINGDTGEITGDTE